MEIEKIKKIATECRLSIEETPPRQWGWRSSLAVATFPKGCCGEASKLLADHICQKMKISLKYVSGRNGGFKKEIGSHAWLEFNDIVIDITSDQFNDSEYTFEPVYVGARSGWYMNFEIDERQSYEICCAE